MESLYVGFTLGDIVGLAHEHTLTYQECAGILEEELIRRFPWIDPDKLYSQIKNQAANDLDYCERLVNAGKKLEEAVKS